MRYLFITAIIIAITTIIYNDINHKENSMNKTNPPIAKKIPHKFTVHGETITDDYAWLRADGWPEKVTDKEVISHLEEENKYFDGYMKPLESKKEEFFEELKGRIKLADQSTYVKKDEYYYYSRTEADKDYAIYCRKFGWKENSEEILLDVNELAKDKKYTALGSFTVSPDHKLIAYSIDFTGVEKYTIKIFDIEKQKYLPDEIPDTIGAIVWHEDMSGFFYTPTDENWRTNKVFFHKLGTDIKEDQLILHEKDLLFNVGVSKSSSREYIFISVSGHGSNEIYYIDMLEKSLKTNLFLPRKDTIFYSIDHSCNYFYMSTNDGAKNFYILRSESPTRGDNINWTESHDYSDKSNWEKYIPERKDAYLSGFDLTEDYLLLDYSVNGLPEIIVKNIDTGEEKTVNFPDAAYTASIYSTNFEENDIRISYSSLARPNTTYYYSNEDKLVVLKEQEIPSGFNPDEYQVERIFADTDGVRVPISLFYKKSLFKKDGSSPLYLYGYGSYGIGMSPAFRNSAVSLVNRGFVYAIAHIRGGDDLGHDWYEAAKFLNKKRTFNDFIACAEKLIEDKYTSEGNIAIMGGSAGGMLIGNVINQRPELFKVAIAHVPFVDVLNTMLDADLPLTPGEYKEWGTPQEKEYFDYIKSYSPYDNIKKQNYPSLFVTAGLSDPRVGYWEAAKWVAKLREHKTDNNILVYKTNMEFGHSGASGRFDYLKEAAEDLVFIIDMFGRE